MNVRALAVLSVLSLPLAAAQTAPPVPATPPAPTAPAPTPLPGHVPAGLTTTWTAFLAGGGTAELLGADGSVIGSVNADGTVTLSGTLTLSDVKAVRVTPPTGQGDATTFALTRDLSRPGAIKLAWTGPNGKLQSLPLPALLHRQADGKAADKPREEATAPAETEDRDKAAGGKKAGEAPKEPPAQGKGKGKK
ncbi:hypothetical protein [Deinococcus koreensis]|uniref:Uncharacterized protein n=1 Tax=Deinococcus koreensis TaxID=2054903 RepID=A0A2K3UV63_9DEIO|nr:hypothetical protein [Deinococcus koreensis]PNY80416.1 hypothetical protein CVO96_02660 [Deinococcus koreensis]